LYRRQQKSSAGGYRVPAQPEFQTLILHSQSLNKFLPRFDNSWRRAVP
jgi:hypothetical protein